MKTIPYLAFFVSCVLLSACKERSEVEVIRMDFDKEISSLMAQADSVSFEHTNGDTSIRIQTSPDEYSLIRKDGTVVNGLQKFKAGVRIFIGEYYPNGQLKGKLSFNPEGKMDGLITCYHEDGRIKGIGRYKDGKKSGTWKRYDEQGYLESEEEH